MCGEVSGSTSFWRGTLVIGEGRRPACALGRSLSHSPDLTVRRVIALLYPTRSLPELSCPLRLGRREKADELLLIVGPGWAHSLLRYPGGDYFSSCDLLPA